jgi:inner membrane protein
LDSLTHIVIGAAIGELILGKQLGRKAMLVGALAKTIPDFDIFYTGLEDPFKYMCHHRGHTHSLLWETLYAFPIAYLFYRLFSKKVSFKRWAWLFLACLWGHSLLDVCTNFGTQLFLPVTNHLYSFNNLAIIDIFFTLPMIVLLIIGLCMKNNSSARIQFSRSVLIYCFLYLGFTFGNKVYANRLFEKSLEENKIHYSQSITNPTILNNFLWYGIASNDSMLYIAENSLLFPKEKMEWLSYPRNQYLLENHSDVKNRNALLWFSKGFDLSEQNGDTLNVYSVKFGRTNMTLKDMRGTFGFYYRLHTINGKPSMTMFEPKLSQKEFKEGVLDLYSRVLGEK